jgi:hypothetical protein
VQLKKDAQGIDKLAEELEKICTEQIGLKQQATSIYEDLGAKLNRYYDIKKIETECKTNKLK